MGEGEKPLYFFDRVLGDREELNLPLPARPGDFCSPQTPTKLFKYSIGWQALHGKDSASIWMMRSRELVMEAHGFVFLRLILSCRGPTGSPTGLIPFTYTYCHSSLFVIILLLLLHSPLLFPRSLSPSLNTGEREKGLSKVKVRHDFLQGNLFKRMNKSTVCYATSQEENFADGFFPGFQAGAGSSFEEMNFSC
ncbi:hypothetical protein SADUNF_Sadunf08G0081500 [Salix dunnii]|uniref:Uncharacterized protein n=1 Tax=Salix dunnii TaxID=1413687 RepID=A0A835JXH1_9ROSI|nr:hypothetical protein SADUNF_Sadunf08G0081500 [Salix dunnii]